MVATFEIHEGNSTAPGTIGSVGNLNMGTNDSKELTPATYPITVGNKSYEKWFVGSWYGAFTQVDNVQFYTSAGSYGTAEVIMWTGSETGYVQPIVAISTVAVGSVPVADPGTANVSLGSALAGSLIGAATGSRSDWIVLQYQVGSTADPGPTNQKTFTFEWDEQ